MVKSLLIGGLWLFSPYWLFAAAALFFYFFPFFNSRRWLIPFVVFLFFAAILPSAFVNALLLTAAIFLIGGAKNLILVERREAYQMLFLILIFFALEEFFRHFSIPRGGREMAALATAAVFVLLLNFFLDFSPTFSAFPPRRKFLLVGVGGIILWQWLEAMLFLPLNRFYQTALVFLLAAALAELLFAHADGSLGRQKILFWFSVLFASGVIILAVNPWKI